MAKKRKSTMYMADFETTVYDGQTSTEVWAAALVKKTKSPGKRFTIKYAYKELRGARSNGRGRKLFCFRTHAIQLDEIPAYALHNLRCEQFGFKRDAPVNGVQAA